MRAKEMFNRHQVSEKLWLFNHKRADFWLPNFGFKRSLLSLLKSTFLDSSYQYLSNDILFGWFRGGLNFGHCFL